MSSKIKFAIALLLIASPLLIYAQEDPATTTPELVATSTEEIVPEEPAATSTPEVATTTEEMATTTDDATTTVPNNSTSTPTIASGDAVAMANILNIVNTNFVNSSGVILFSNFFDYLKQTLDLRDLLSGGNACGDTPCTSGDQVGINLSNNAQIDNSILLNASTGNNEIDNAGDATINTGNAYAGLNLINLANNNFVDSNYLLVTLNAFNGVGGDIVFPSLKNFFSSLSSGASSPSSLDLTSNAEVDNNVTTDAQSGGNQTSDTASSTITTGDSHSSTGVFNEINSNLAGGTKVSILFRIHGNWAGQIFGAPPNLGWLQGNDGSIYMFDTGTTTPPSAPLLNQGGEGGGELNVTGTSTTLINNNVSVVALTGENRINDANTALINTGNAYAGANIMNVANSNVVGQNWILAIINIFGDFTGNIAFGRPDLWVGEQVQTPAKIVNGSDLDYKFTVINNGDSDSSQTILADNYDANQLQILDSSIPYTTNSNGTITWDLGAMPAGAAAEVNYHAKIVGAGYASEITDTVTVSAHETDNNPNDNTDTATITTDQAPARKSSGSKSGSYVHPLNGLVLGASVSKQLDVTRNDLIMTTSKSQNLNHQKLVVRNPSTTPIENVVLHDTLRDPSGKIVHDEKWDLGKVLGNEEITLGYDIKFAADAPIGLYTLTTNFDGFQKSSLPNGYILLKTGTVAPVATAHAKSVVKTDNVASSTVVRKIELVADVVATTTTPKPVPTSPIKLPMIFGALALGLWASWKWILTASVGV